VPTATRTAAVVVADSAVTPALLLDVAYVVSLLLVKGSRVVCGAATTDVACGNTGFWTLGGIVMLGMVGNVGVSGAVITGTLGMVTVPTGVESLT
jgi:hypothetical protein